MFDILEADIVVMQELKIQRKDLRDDMVLVPGWDCFFSLPKHKKGMDMNYLPLKPIANDEGYSGVGIYTRQSVCEPIRAEEGLLGVLCRPGSSVPYRELPDDEAIGGYLSYSEMMDLGVDPAALDAEGRCVVVEFPAFVLFGVYCPANSRGGDAGVMFRHAFWNALDMRLRKLDAMGKRVILTGDLNNAKNELDIAGAEEDKRKEGTTHAEFVSTPNRRILNQLLEDGEVFGPRDEGREKSILFDACRAFHPKRQGMYTHWDTKKNMRPGNFGSRIDYLLTSILMKSWCTDSNIQEGLLVGIPLPWYRHYANLQQGSDHCPVYVVFDDVVLLDNEKRHLKDIMNPPGVFEDGQRLQEVPTKATLAFSARLLPEFNVGQRQNIKDMFKRQPSATNTTFFASPQTSLPMSPPKATEAAASSSFAQSSTQTSTTSTISTQSPSKASAVKRKPSDSNGSKAKKVKQTSTAPTPPGRAQGTLRAFFSAKPTEKATMGELTAAEEPIPASLFDAVSSLDHVTATNNVHSPKQNIATSQVNDARGIHSQRESPDSIIDRVAQAQDGESDSDLTQAVEKRINSSEKWGMLMRKPKIPLCEDHEEPCQAFQTKKKGINCGRTFYICARPVGPSGDKEKNTQWRCWTFIWASDWQGGAGGSS
jgi:AP endonuclease-2